MIAAAGERMLRPTLGAEWRGVRQIVGFVICINK